MAKKDNTSKVQKQLERSISRAAASRYRKLPLEKKRRFDFDYRVKHIEQRRQARERDRALRWMRAGERIYDARYQIVGGVFSLIVPVLVSLFLMRAIFAPDVSHNVYTLFLDLLQYFGSESFPTEVLLHAIRNLATVHTLDLTGLGIIDAILEFIGTLLLLLELLFALLMNAASVILFVFRLVFYPAT